LRDEAEAVIAAETPEEKRLAFVRIMGQMDARAKERLTNA